MRQICYRGLKLFFRDKGGVFFSFLGVVIIFALFLFFIGDSIMEGLDFITNVKEVMNDWVVAGMLASSGITTSMGAYAVMVSDKEQRNIKDFYSSPVKKWEVVGGYLMTGFFISVAMTGITFLLGEIYIAAQGGAVLEPMKIAQIGVVILLSSFASSALVSFLVSFLETVAAYTTASIVLGTLIGFLVGAYICIGDLPSGVQAVIKCFPCAHAAVLFRQILMEDAMAVGFSGLPQEVLEEFRETVGVTFCYGQYRAQPWLHIAVLVGSGVCFYVLAIAHMSRKK
ncbi:MAG: ABC transporter permease [Lachnospiraceae bacterium]|nr:ABC transporter permease [Robinsoniella sp.]MDY3767848.1 ABC transporter permease [Lachnospiraceae bacterium]